VIASPDVIAFLLAVAGLAALGLGTRVVHGFGRGYRVGRILRAAPEVTLAEVEAAARGDRRVYVRVRGRVSSDEEFPDEHDRPLVYRRRRLQLGGRSGWESIDDQREAVPFGIAARGAHVGIDVDAIDEGLVVLPRESLGTAGEVPEYSPAGTPPNRPMRLLVEQVSAIEHVYVAGVPALDTAGQPMLTSGAGRPLVVCALDLPEAMRLLGGANRARAAGAAALLAAGCLLLVAAAAAALAGPVHASSLGPVAGTVTGTGSRVFAPPSPSLRVAAQPDPSAAVDPGSAAPSPGAIPGGDTRSSGTPPSFVGQPILAALAVVILGVLTAGASLLYVRLTQRRS
jgi:hypothetical protein